MTSRTATFAAIAAAAAVFTTVWPGRHADVQAQAQKPGNDFAAVPGEIGGQDIFGPYDVVRDWPKDISTLPGNEKWTWGAGQSVFAESPNRVFVLFRGELPKIKRPETKLLSALGPSIQFPIGRLPWRDATVSSPPGAGGTGGEPDDGPKLWKGTLGVDAKWEHCINVVDANGNIIETWTQWDKILKRPHFVAINPYDPEKHVWVVDDHMHAIYKFTHDGKKLVQTIGTPDVKGADGTHFNRPTFLAWLPDSTHVRRRRLQRHARRQVRQGRQVPARLGPEGTLPNDKRPGYMNNVHGIAVDPETRRVFVNDRGNHRVQVFDENGKYLYEWNFGDDPSDIHLLYIGADRNALGVRPRHLEDAEVRSGGALPLFLGHLGRFPRRLLGRARLQRRPGGQLLRRRSRQRPRAEILPRKGANPAYLMSRPVYAAWK